MPVVFTSKFTPVAPSLAGPPVPTGLVAVPLTLTSIKLTWTPVTTDPGGPGIKDYGVYRIGVGLLGYISTPTYTDTGLITGNAYTYTVTSRDLNNLESAQSAPATSTTYVAPPAPTGLTATVLSTTQIRLDWNVAGDPGGPGISRYGVYQNGVKLGEVAAITYLQQSLTPGTTYSYQVSAIDVNNVEGPLSAAVPATTQGGTNTLKQDTGFVFTANNLGSKSVQLLPAVWDDGRDAPYGSTSSQWTAVGSKFPTTAGGIYNVQNQPPGFSPSGAFVTPVNSFVKAVISGCHLVSGSNDSNGVNVGFAWTAPNNGTTVTYPFFSQHEYDYCYDRNMFNDPQSDNNTKTIEFGDTNVCFPANGQYGYWEPFPISLFPISNISRTNPCVVTCPMNQAVSPASVGDVLSLFGAVGSTQANALASPITAQGGSNGAFTYTLGAVDSTGWSAYQASIPIVSATNSNPCTITINTAAPLPERTFIWVTGAVGGTWAGFTSGVPNFNQKQNLCLVNWTGSAGAWTAQVIDGQFAGVNIDSTSFGTLNSNSASFTTGGLSVPFTNSPVANVPPNTSWIAKRNFRMNPIGQLQNPDAAGHSMTSLAQLNMPSAGGNIRRRFEIGWSQSATLTPGYFRIYDNQTLVFNFVGRTDNLSASGFFRHVGMGSMYHRDRGPNEFAYFFNQYYDWGSGAAAVAVLYLCNATTLAASTIAEPQPHLTSWANTQITGSRLWQGKHANGSTVYLIARTEAGTEVTDGVTYTLSPTSTPTITTASLAGATQSTAYSQTISVTGGTAPYTYYLASSNTGAAPCVNTWAVAAATGTITGTPTVIGTDQIVVTVIDANGYNGATQFSLATSASGTGFDFYISSTGNDANPGTLASPWAITAINSQRATYAGKRVGIIGNTSASPTVYGISSLMTTDAQNAARNPALNINGGPDSSHLTYIAACNSSGIYTPRCAKIIANDNGVLGGSTLSTNAMIGCNNTVTNRGNWTIDGLVIAGFSCWAIHVGNSPSGGVNVNNWIIQNCEITGGSTVNATGQGNGVNCAPLVIYTSSNGTVTQNWFHDNLGGGTVDTAHFSCVYQWGELGPTAGTFNTTYSNNTIKASGGLHGKEANQQGTIVTGNYIEWTPGFQGQNSACVQGFDGAPTAGLTMTTVIANNVLVTAGQGINVEAELANGGFTTPCKIYNNTMVSTASLAQYLRYFEATAGTNLLSYYNNLYVDQGHVPQTNYGYMIVNIDAFALCDYNCYGGGTGSQWNTVPNGTHTSAGVVNRTFANWKTVINGGADAHSLNTVATITNNGTYAKQYQVTTGAAFGAGKVGGVIGGAACNIGAWDGTVTQIGASWVS